jgi:hypothetical protein
MRIRRYLLPSCRPTMSRHPLLIFTVFLSLLFGPQARTATPPPATMPGCAVMTCTAGCCANLPCCMGSAKDHTQPQPARAAQRTGSEFSARIERRASPILYLVPASERNLVIREEAQAAHTLPTRAATCIQLV